MTATAKMTTKGQITVPKPVRDQLGLVPGDTLEFVEANGTFVIRRHTEQPRFAKYRGVLEHLRGQDPDSLLEALRGDG